MQSDRELLEWAAKATGDEVFGEPGCCFRRFINHSAVTGWNPLTDDGDALRLAVRLNLGGLRIGKNAAWVEPMDETYCKYDTDPYAATRRAIVRAAAEIGRGMK